MIKPVNKIVIVGGGSAGWMSAAALIRAFPEKEIIVIESPDYPTVGVGESTLGQINFFLRYLGIKDEDFMHKCDASYKMSIKFTDFYEKDYGSFHYPFGEPYLENSMHGLRDWFYKKAAFNDIPNENFIKTYFPQAALFLNNKIDTNENGEFENFNFGVDVAYHFDATKFGLWLKENYCIPRGVKLISDTVQEAVVNEDGIEYLILNDNENIYADLFVDCTGFKSLLLGQSLGVKFNSYDDLIPNNRAWATRIPYKNKEKELEPFTNCTALGNGWVWNIPIWSRIGTGYVYSDKHITPEEAKQEFKQHLMSNKMLFPRTEEELEELTFSDIRMRVGIHEKTFYKNVVAIGLSAGFIEPLESNGLFSAHEFLFRLIRALKRNALSQLEIDLYNEHCYTIFRSFSEFVSQHYAMSVRNDTQYWKDISKRNFSHLISDRNSNYRLLFDIQSDNNYPQHNGLMYISCGMNFVGFDDVEMYKYDNETYANNEKLMLLFQQQDLNIQKWETRAKSKSSLYDFLSQKIYCLPVE